MDNNHVIKVRGARQHNLKNIDIDIPKDKLVVFTGVSGSGKSSMAFDTIYAEGQRRYVESLATYARQFLGIMNKPDVDFIEGLSPAISIDQKTTSHNPRSTVGTVTEVYDYLRLLFARVGHPHCPICGREISSQTADQIVDGIVKLVKESIKQDKVFRLLLLSPVVRDRKGEFSSLFENLKAKGYRRVRVDGKVHDLDEELVLIKTNKHTIEAVVDRLSFSNEDFKDESRVQSIRMRLNEAVEGALNLSDGFLVVSRILDAGFDIPDYPKNMEDHLFSERFACPVDNISLPEIEPRTFSFNSPHGACPKCLGIGRVKRVNTDAVFSPTLSIKEGGILPFATIFEHETWLSRLILQVCEEEGIDTNKAVGKLSSEEIEVLLHGTGAKVYKVKGTNRFGKSTFIWESFPGIVGELERRHTQSESDYIKNSIERYMVETPCEECGGTRLKKEALSVTIADQSISDVSNLSITETLNWIMNLSGKVLSEREREIGQLIIKEISNRLTFLKDVGLDYLTISRSAGTLAGGEAQRIRLASQIGSGLTGVLYVLDEPTIGLHPRDNRRLIETLKKLKELGNTVVVVEHDKEVMEAADYIFDFGPGAGKHGGTVVAKGTLQELSNDPQSITGKYLSGKRDIVYRSASVTKDTKTGAIVLTGANENNLRNVDLEVPIGKFVVVTGVSGSGKSTLVVDTFYHAVAREVNPLHRDQPGAHKQLLGMEHINKVILIDQSPIGRTPRSNPATYTKIFDLVRQVYANTREAKAYGFKTGRFSFNVKGGRCEACEGQGQVKIEMQFMPDIWVDCEVCHGKRYNSQTLEVTYKGKNIAEVLEMTVSEAKEFFHIFPHIVNKLETLESVGMEYMNLGQSATTLSGGEAQRIKLASELSRRATGDTLYILDEPTTGLHFADLEKLLAVLKILVERGNTVLVIEHNLDIIKNADWIIDLGPEGGSGGGTIVAAGTPKSVSQVPSSYTGQFLADILK
jgi:excinuclease ABC subunit A